MTVDDIKAIDLPGAPPGLSLEQVRQWDNASWVRVEHQSEPGRTRFACTVAHRPPLWFVTDCLPQRRDPEVAASLLAVCDWLAVERAATEVVAIHPEFLEERLVAAGAHLLHRMVPMWLRLDDDLLLLHGRAVPDGEFLQLELSAGEAEQLADLSPQADRDNDLRVWRTSLDGDYGAVVPDASVKLVGDHGIRAAVAVTEYLGTPLIAHFVTAATERGSGLGRAVLVESLQRLSAAGYVDCRLHVVESNWVAHRLYRSLGFVQDRPTLRVSHLSYGSRGRRAGDA